MNPEANIELYQLFKEWNPLRLNDKEIDFDSEIYECMEIVLSKDSKHVKTKNIHNVFKFSFEESPDEADIEYIVNKANLIKLQYDI